MSQAARDRLVAAALVISESAWVYALLGIVGLALGTRGSPLGWLAVLSLMAAAAILARVLSRLSLGDYPGEGLPAQVVQAAAGGLAIYLAVSTQVAITDGFWDLDWPGVVVSGSEVAGANFRATVGAIAGVVLWWRGGRIGSGEEPGASLEQSYRIGTVLMVIAVLVDLGTETDLNAVGAMFAMFAAALGGLGVARLGRGTGGTGATGPWLAAVGATVAAVLAVGFAFSLVRRTFLDVVNAPVTEVLGWMGTVIFYAFLVPVAWVVSEVVGLLVGLFAGDGGSGEVVPLGESIGEQFLQRQSEQAPAYVAVLEWILLAVLSAVGIYILSRALRRRGRSGGRDEHGVRESVRGEADPVLDAAELLLGLLPSALRGRRRAAPIALPQGPPGVVGALRCYYRLLLHAGSLGARRPPAATPNEYMAELDALVPGGIAGRATESFSEALYGGLGQPDSRLKEMDAELDRLGAPEL